MLGLIAFVAFVIGTVMFGLNAFGGGTVDTNWAFFFWGIGFCCEALGGGITYARERL
jgi:hypothetical protein